MLEKYNKFEQIPLQAANTDSTASASASAAEGSAPL